jgi:hypothetical protein
MIPVAHKVAITLTPLHLFGADFLGVVWIVVESQVVVGNIIKKSLSVSVS